MKLLLYCSLLIIWTVDAFTTSTSRLGVEPLAVGHSHTTGRRLTVPSTVVGRGEPLYFFGKNNNKDKSETDAPTGDEEADATGENKSMMPFFGRFMRQTENSKNKEEGRGVTETATRTAVVEPSAVKAATTATAIKVPERPKVPEDPVEKANFLRAQAGRARLEAERMDVELTLSKIERLEKQLRSAKKKGETVEDFQRQLDLLQAKLRGEVPPPAPPVVVAASKSSAEDAKAAAVVDSIGTADLSTSMTTMTPSTPSNVLDMSEILNSKELDEILATVERSPGFFKKIMASMVEIEYDTAADINNTQLATRLVQMGSRDYTWSKSPKPTFTEAQIDEVVKRIEKIEVTYPDSWGEDSFGDDRKLGEYILESEYYIETRLGTGEDANILELVQKVGEGEEWLKPILDAVNATAVDRFIETAFPKCMRKEDAQEPTMVQVQSVVANVLPQAKFSSSSKPEKVLGGYVLTGSHKYETGDELIAAIDKELAKTGLADKMTVLYCPNFMWFANAAEEELGLDSFPDEVEPIIYITGPDIVRDSQPVLLSLTSGFGIATCWYLSIYPFMLNPALSQRVEEQLGVADAGMQYDLSWLTDLSVPLFGYIISITLLHEVGHRIVAAAYDMKVSVPTLVPSLVTGTTGTVTTFKEPPKNKEALFDFAVTGPLFGIVASVAALVVGSQLTISSDPATMPALPLEILRQSTLGGGIIDSILQGSLFVPDGAPMTGIMISLHPLAIAGYISLIVNALALLPIGTTDGGRIALALFGRPAKLAVGNLFLFALLVAGILGSDLFLFYCSFILAFQTGNEVPARNEVDDISFPRVVVATTAFAISFLTLVPFQ